MSNAKTIETAQQLELVAVTDTAPSISSAKEIKRPETTAMKTVNALLDIVTPIAVPQVTIFNRTDVCLKVNCSRAIT